MTRSSSRLSPRPSGLARSSRALRVAMAMGALLATGATVAACSREPERSEATFCAQVKDVKSLDETLHNGDTIKIAAELAKLRELQLVAPLEIEPKIALLISFSEDYARTLGTVKDPDEALNQVSERRAQDVPAVIDAATAVARYAFDRCKITLGSEVPGTGTTVVGIDNTAPPATTKDGKAITTVKPTH